MFTRVVYIVDSIVIVGLRRTEERKKKRRFSVTVYYGTCVPTKVLVRTKIIRVACHAIKTYNAGTGNYL